MTIQTKPQSRRLTPIATTDATGNIVGLLYVTEARAAEMWNHGDIALRRRGAGAGDDAGNDEYIWTIPTGRYVARGEQP